MKIISLLILLFTLPFNAPNQTRNMAPPAEMKKVSFLVGQWKGEGWIEFGAGQRRTFTETESVQSKLGGEVLLIEGLGKSKTDPNTVIHNAIALLSYDARSSKFRFQAHQAGGGGVDSEAKVGDSTLEWGINQPPAPNVRFVIRLNDKGQWFEVGEISRDGKSWSQFFEMTLTKTQQ